MLLTVNGSIVGSPDRALSALDRGFLLGDGVFETLRLYQGTPFGLRAHLDRLSDACRRTGIKLDPNIESVVLGEIERAHASGFGEAFLRITISRGSGLGVGADPPDSTLVTLIDKLPMLDPLWYSGGISVVVAGSRRNEFAITAGIKTTAYMESIIAFRAAVGNGAGDAIFLDTQGHLSEATASNLFVVREGILYTPPLQCGALPGITRACVMGIASTEGITVNAQQPLPLAELEKADEVFLTSSIREVVPVVSFDGSLIGGGEPGPVTRRVMAAYSEITR